MSIAMTIIEALKKLKLLEKKMESNISNITKYSSIQDNEIPSFWTIADQTTEVASFVQSNIDLAMEYSRLKQAIDRTNIEVVVDFGNEKYSIAHLILLKRKLGNTLERTYRALNDSSANSRIRSKKADGTESQVVRLYDEKAKNESLNGIQTMISEIDSRLEVINATTSLYQ